MSKYIKDLIAQDISRRLEGVEDLVLVNMIGVGANDSVKLRKQLRDKDIQVLVVKNSMAARATEGTSLAPAFEGMTGSLAVCWGSEDFISLVKEITAIDKAGDFKGFATRGGVMDGEQLSPERVHEISKWPNRQEQLSILVGQILGPGRELAGALEGPGGQLASQIDQIEDKEG